MFRFVLGRQALGLWFGVMPGLMLHEVTCMGCTGSDQRCLVARFVLYGHRSRVTERTKNQKETLLVKPGAS